MERLQESQLAKKVLLLLLFFFLLLTPFISTSMRSSYLYFLLNLLIIVLGIEAGFLSAISKPLDERSKPVTVTAPITNTAALVNHDAGGCSQANTALKSANSVDKEMVAKMKRCPSKPSLFFIGGCGGEEGLKEEEVEEERKKVGEVEVAGELSKQELFARAEVFIGNFYKQLKMQREASWKKIHGLCHIGVSS